MTRSTPRRDRSARRPGRRRAPLLGPCALALLAALAVALAAAAPAAPAASARAAAAPRCATSELVMWLNAEGSGTAGSFYFKIELDNFSGHRCTLHGYPGVSAVDLHGRRIGASAGHEVTRTPALVTLAPEQQATAIVRVVDVGALPASCRPTAAAGFRVYPPGQSSSKVVPFPFRTCANASQHAVSVRAVTRE